MGEEDTRRQALNVARMRLLGAEVIPVTTGSRTLKDAINEAMRDWVANVDPTHYLLGTVAGPHPFPAMVRDFHRVIGVEARAQILDLTGRLPDAVAACVGGGSNAIGIFHAFLDDPSVALYGFEAGGDGVETGRHAATHHRRRARRPARHALLPAAGRRRARPSSRTRSPPAWTTRASAPSTPGCTTPAARPTGRSPTPRRWTRSRCCAAPRASSRPSSRAHALAGALEVGRELGPEAASCW